VHATLLARSLGVQRVLVPALSSTFSALGCLASELRYDVVQTFRRLLDALSEEQLVAQFQRIEAAARSPLLRERYRLAEIELRRSIDLRYAGQNYELEVPLAHGSTRIADVRQRYTGQHIQRYGYATDEPVECVALRVAALVPNPDFRMPERQQVGEAVAAEGYPCFVPGAGAVRVTVYRRAGLDVGRPIQGPALIEDEQSTIVLLPRQTGQADAVGNLLIDVG
jgi:N-methylhydantoinase A